MNKLYFIISCILLSVGFLTAQETMENILQEVLNKSFATKTAGTQKAIVSSRFDFYKSQLRPNVGLNANLPNYSKTSSPVLQPDGTISFRSIRQANSSVSLSATQVLTSTGGTVFANSDLQRFDDFSLKSNTYNGIPLRIGIVQPIFGYNRWKYDKEIQPLLIEESEKNYNIQIEQALGDATNLYFNILIAKQNLDIAETNQAVNEKLLLITEERLELGKVSRDEKLQLEIELNTAKLSVSQATSQLQVAISFLDTFLGNKDANKDRTYAIPEATTVEQIDMDGLLSAYLQNRPEIIAYQRAILESAQDLAKAKNDFGWQAEIQASIGLARGSQELSEIYTNPFDEQQFNISVQIPLLDWGRKKVAMEQVNLQQLDIENAYQQSMLELENNIRQQALLFLRLQQELNLLLEIMNKAEERFTISNNRYTLGNIDITNLTLAHREKDQAKRNYINALKSYWTIYYNLRALSGYDILQNKNINYN